MSKYPKSPVVLRAYGHFMEKVKNDVDAAERAYMEAENVDEEKQPANIKQLVKTTSNIDNLVDAGALDEATTMEGEKSSKSLINTNNNSNNNKTTNDDSRSEAEKSFRSGRTSASQVEAKRKMINTADSNCCLNLLILSIVAFSVIFLIIIISVCSTVFSNFNYNDYRDACIQSAVPLHILKLYRREDVRRIYLNATFNSNISIECKEAQHMLNETLREVISRIKYKTFKRDEVFHTQQLITAPILSGNTLQLVQVNKTEEEIIVSLVDGYNELAKGIETSKFSSELQEFWYMWVNRDLFTSIGNSFCVSFYKDIILAKAADINILIIIVVATVACHVVYLALVFLPSLYMLLQKKQQILSLFKLVPKETVGQVYKKLDNLSKDSAVSVSKNSTTLNASCMILLWFVFFLQNFKLHMYSACIIIVLECVVISLYLADHATDVTTSQSTIEITYNAANVFVQLNQAVLNTFNLLYPYSINTVASSSPLVDYSSAVFATNVSSIVSTLSSISYHWNSVKYGTGTVTGQGLANLYSEIDQYVQSTCSYKTTVKTDFQVHDCLGLDILIERLNWAMTSVLKNAFNMTHETRLQYFQYMLDLNDMFNRKFIEVTDLFLVYKSDAATGVPVDLPVLLVVTMIIIILFSYPLFILMSTLQSVNFQIRQLFMFLPSDCIEAVYVVKYLNLTFV